MAASSSVGQQLPARLEIVVAIWEASWYESRPPKMRTQFDIFLSYNSVDKPLVENVARMLKESDFKPWFDAWALVPGTRWQGQLADGLRACGTCGIFIGPNGFGDWSREELDVAQNRAAKDPNFRLIPILLPGMSHPFDFASLPPFLATRTWVDFRAGLDDERAFDILTRAIQGIPPGSEVAATPLVDCPYRGLETFEEEDAKLFFGRERDIQRVIEKLKGARFLAVLGPSGSGKSSLVRAGVIPRLREGALPGSRSWNIHIMRPGADPITALAVAIAQLRPETRVKQFCDDLLVDAKTFHREVSLAQTLNPKTERFCWVIDQLEEVFTLCTSERDRSQFLANIVFASSIPDSPCVILLTMRADFYWKCAAYPEFAERIAAQQFLVSLMDREMLRQAIEEPARRSGLQFQHGLADTILKDVENQPGSLPLLEHALLELWNFRSGSILTLDAYERSGRVVGAISKRAQAIFDNFTSEQQQAARRILLRLIQPGEGTDDTRRRVGMSELITNPGDESLVESVIGAFAQARLLTAS